MVLNTDHYVRGSYLQDTHCLWEWAKKNRTYRRGCLTGRAWESNKQFFGDSHEIQIRRRNSERYAWYDLIQVSDITSHTNVQLDPDREDSYLQSVMWWGRFVIRSNLKFASH